MRPPLFSSVIKLSQTMDFNNETLTPERMSSIVISALADMIEAVDDVTDREMIHEWLKELNAGWVRDISDTVASISDWGANFKTSFVCVDCGEVIETEISTNPLTFFI
jgi:predicted transcriptional regulator